MQEQDIQKQLDKIWNGWKLEGLLGEGAFGRVYCIKREEFGYAYKAALKVITIPQSSSEVKSVMNEGMNEKSITSYFYSIVEDIVEEFALMSRLKGNTNIVSYEDHAVIPLEDAIGWNIFIRMELLTPLLDYIRDNPLSINQTINLGVDMCQALEVCQRYNIIHRDIKPENIFVSDIGRFKLGDFGIARQLEKTSGNLSKKGTFNYMAPEIYKGEEYNSTVDIYSLGIVLYRFLNNNRIPFLPPYPTPLRYSDKEAANVKRMSGVKPPAPCNADEELAEIILRACAYTPKERYENAKDMKDSLLAVLQNTKEIVYSGDEKVKKKSLDIENREIHNEEISEQENEATVYMFDTEESRQRIKEREEEKRRKRETEEKEKERQREIERYQQEEKNKENEYQLLEEEEQRMLEPLKMEMPVKKSSNRIAKKIVIAALILVLVSAGIAGVYLYRQSQWTVPDLANISLTEAMRRAEENSLVLIKTEEEYSDTVTKGCIITQSIEAGTIVKKGTEIQVVVSCGLHVTAPVLVGMALEEAELTVTQQGLAYVIGEERYSDEIAEGIIISQYPDAGVSMNEGDTIEIVVSRGKEQVEMPDTVGMSVKEAKKILADAGIICTISEEYSDTVKKNKVIGQSIEAGSLIDKGTEVVLVVSLGQKEKPTEQTPAKQYTPPPQEKTTQSGAEDIHSWEVVN